MSHLRPNNADGGSKSPAHYTPGERASALTQMLDAANARITQGKPIDRKTAELIIALAEGTEKADSMPKEITEASTGKKVA